MKHVGRYAAMMVGLDANSIGNKIELPDIHQRVNDRAEAIQQSFPNISSLERFVLSTTLDDRFKLTPCADAVQKYVGYLSAKDQWEGKQKTEAKGRPITFYHRDRAPD